MTIYILALYYLVLTCYCSVVVLCDNSCFENSSIANNSTFKFNICENEIALLDGSSFRFNCGSETIRRERCLPPSRESIWYCINPVPASHDAYFSTKCLNVSLSNNKYIPYTAISSFNLSSVDTSRNCTKDFYQMVVTNNTALIKSPNWPQGYGHDALQKRCRWRINVPSKTKVKVFYMYLHLAGKENGNTVCSSRDNISHDTLLVEAYKDGQIVHTEHHCGYHPSFTKYLDMQFESLTFELAVNTTSAQRNNIDVGFVIGLVFVANDSPNNIFVYWWIIPIIILLSAVFLNCLRKKIKTQRNHQKRRERAFTSSLTTLPKSISTQRHPSVTQHRGMAGIDNLGQVLEEPPKHSAMTQISFSTTVDIYG